MQSSDYDVIANAKYPLVCVCCKVPFVSYRLFYKHLPTCQVLFNERTVHEHILQVTNSAAANQYNVPPDIALRISNAKGIEIRPIDKTKQYWYNSQFQSYWIPPADYTGEYKEWGSNGKLAKHCFYKDGKLHSKYKSWHQNG